MGGAGGRRGGRTNGVYTIRLRQDGTDIVEGLERLPLRSLRALVTRAYQKYQDRCIPEKQTRSIPHLRTYATTDYSLAAWLRINRVLFLGLQPNPDPAAGHYQSALFVFADDGTGKIDTLKRELVNSRYMDYDSAQRFFKKLARDSREEKDDVRREKVAGSRHG